MDELSQTDKLILYQHFIDVDNSKIPIRYEKGYLYFSIDEKVVKILLISK
jgi:hypothetical protein